MSDSAARESTTLHDILRQTGVPSDHYKIRCIERRVAARMRVRGAQNYEDYARILQADPAEARRLAQALTISVSRFFRNRSAFEVLAEAVIPKLWARRTVPVRVWSAGCAAGEEAYSVAALLHRHALTHGGPIAVERIDILASDVDEESLAAAARGVYAEAQLAETPDDLRDRYFRVTNGRATVAPELRALVRFERRDLILDREPDGPFDLVLCRNLIIYLESRAQEALLERLHRCLRPGGFLMLGRVEAVLGRPRRWFEPLTIRSRIYARRD